MTTVEIQPIILMSCLYWLTNDDADDVIHTCILMMLTKLIDDIIAKTQVNFVSQHEQIRVGTEIMVAFFFRSRSI